MAKIKKTKEEDFDALKADLEVRFGRGTVIKASDKKLTEVKTWTPSGSLTLDIATSGKGIPKGGLCTCILGKESSSKTTLALHIIAEEQKKGGLCAFLDIEGTLDLAYTEEGISVDLEKLHLVDRESLLKSLGVKDRDVIAGEEWIELLCKMLKSNLYDIIVFDSVAALIPMSEIQNGLIGGQMSRIASMMAKAYRAVNSALSMSKTGFVYLNQYRMNIGGYGSPFIEPAGESWKYLQALKIEISKKVDKDEDGAYGIIVKGKITKSKVCIPFKEFEYYVEFGKGIQRWKEIMDLAIEYKIIEKVGNTYSYEGNKLGVGAGQLETALQDNPELLEEIKEKVLDYLKPKEVEEITILPEGIQPFNMEQLEKDIKEMFPIKTENEISN